MTPAELRQIAPTARSSLAGPLCDAFDKHWPKYGIDTPERQAHFMAQAAHESAGFTTLEELGRDSYFRRYDPNTTTGKRLGNTKPGDGLRFKGRGIFQLTGRANYAVFGNRLKLDLVDDPDLAAIPDNSVRIACEYWKARGLNAWADRDDVVEVTRRINGGDNGLADRKRYLARAKEVFGGEAAPLGLLAAEDVPDAPIALEPPKGMLLSKEGGAAATIGGYSIWEMFNTGKEWAVDHLNPRDALEWVTDPNVRPWLVIGLLALLIWYWRYRRMHSEGV